MFGRNSWGPAHRHLNQRAHRAIYVILVGADVRSAVIDIDTTRLQCFSAAGASAAISNPQSLRWYNLARPVALRVIGRLPAAAVRIQDDGIAGFWGAFSPLSTAWFPCCASCCGDRYFRRRAG